MEPKLKPPKGEEGVKMNIFMKTLIATLAIGLAVLAVAPGAIHADAPKGGPPPGSIAAKAAAGKGGARVIIETDPDYSSWGCYDGS